MERKYFVYGGFGHIAHYCKVMNIRESSKREIRKKQKDNFERKKTEERKTSGCMKDRSR